MSFFLSTSPIVRRLLLLPLLTVFLAGTAGCDLLGAEDEANAIGAGTALIANQGNFSDANGSITAYDPAADSARQAVLAPLGSIVQSVALIDGTGYVTANSANRIDVFDPATLRRTGQIDSVRSPRYMAAVGPSTAYVTNLYSGSGFGGGAVSVIDLAAGEVVDTVEVGSNPEGITVVGERAFVANHGFGRDSTVSILDTRAHEVIETVDVECDGPRTLHADAEGEVWVLCTGLTRYDQDGNVTGRTDGAVRILDGTSGSVTARMSLDGQVRTIGPGQSSYYSPSARALYAVVDAARVLRFETATNSGLSEVSIPEGDPIGAVAYLSGREVLYLGRVPGFTQAGTVQRVDPETGRPIGSFSAGVAPSHIAFRREAP